MASPAEQGGGSSGLPQFDFNTWPSQVFWLIVAFVLLYFILDRFLLPRLSGVIEDRADRIADNLDAAAKMKSEAELAEANYEKALADARAKAAGIAAEARKEADALMAAETVKAESDMVAKISKAEERIRALTDEAMASANDVATEAADAMLQRLANVKVHKATLTKAVNDAVSKA